MAKARKQKPAPADVKTSPPRQSYRDLPIAPVSYWDTVPMVRRALDELERGMFRSAAHLADAMLRDDRIAGVMATRLNGLLSQPLDFEPPSGEDAPADEVQVADAVKLAWPKMTTEADLEDLLKWGILLGLGPAELLWQLSADEWVPRLKVWHPSNIYWRWDTRSYWLNTQDGPVELVDPRATETGGGKWALFTPYGYERGWMRGAVRALALPWLVRGFARRDWAYFSEVHGQGIKKGLVPITASEEERTRFIQGLQTMGAAGVIECPTLPDGTKFDLELVEAMATTYEGFQQLLVHADTAIAVVVLGQNLTTEIGQGAGSRAAAEVHDEVRVDYQKADNRKFGGTLQNQVIRPYALYNAGDGDLAPRPCWQTEPPEDLNQLATSLQAVGGFLTAAKNAGAPVDQRALLERMKVPLLTPEQEAKEKAEAAERAAQAMAALQAQGGQDEGGDQGDDEGAEDETKLSARESLPRGARRGQAYVDRLVDVAIQRAAQSLDVDLQELRDQVAQATSPEDLRRRLVKAYRGMDVAQLTLLVDRAQVLAELAGNRSVLDDA